MKIRLLTHSSIRIEGSKTIYIDPFGVKENFNDADYILITHSHFDHYSIDDIKKVINKTSVLIAPLSMKNDIDFDHARFMEAGQIFLLDQVQVKAVPAYNVGKPFHTKDKHWLGYCITMDNRVIYIAGDTDLNEDNVKIKCDVAMVPIGGKYTMDAVEAAKLVNIIKPKVAICTHYGNVVGSKEDENKFAELVDKKINVQILMEDYGC